VVLWKNLFKFFRKKADMKNRSQKQMINPVSSASVVPQAVQSAPQSKPQQAASSEPKDTVHLSSQAKASGDVDHDGDSH
jgi:hypothetical protein